MIKVVRAVGAVVDLVVAWTSTTSRSSTSKCLRYLIITRKVRSIPYVLEITLPRSNYLMALVARSYINKTSTI